MPTGTHTAKTLVEAACPKPRADETSWVTQHSGLRLRDQRSLTIERKDRRPLGQRSVIFFKLGKQRI